MVLEQAFASVVKYVQDKSDSNAALYFDDIPENFMVPAIYFPVPRTESRKVTFQSYLTEIYMDIWFIASEDWLAYADAANVRDCILIDNLLIGTVEKDGKPTGKGIWISNLEVRRIDKGVSCLSFALKDYFSKKEEPVTKAGKVILSNKIQSEELYAAWYAATAAQRKEEEVRKACLEEALKNQ